MSTCSQCSEKAWSFHMCLRCKELLHCCRSCYFSKTIICKMCGPFCITHNIFFTKCKCNKRRYCAKCDINKKWCKYCFKLDQLRNLKSIGISMKSGSETCSNCMKNVDLSNIVSVKCNNGENCKNNTRMCVICYINQDRQDVNCIDCLNTICGHYDISDLKSCTYNCGCHHCKRCGSKCVLKNLQKKRKLSCDINITKCRICSSTTELEMCVACNKEACLRCMRWKRCTCGNKIWKCELCSAKKSIQKKHPKDGCTKCKTEYFDIKCPLFSKCYCFPEQNSTKTYFICDICEEKCCDLCIGFTKKDYKWSFSVRKEHKLIYPENTETKNFTVCNICVDKI